MNLQSLADRQEEQSIHAYDVWRGWQDQYELAQMEARLSREGSARGVLLSFPLAVLAVGLGALVVGALFALAVAQ